MPSSRRFIVLVPLCIAIIFLSASCAGTKSSQCKKMVEITRKIASETKTLSDNRKTLDPQKVLQVADAFEGTAKEMKSLAIQDKQLQEYQFGFAKMYLGMGQATRDFVAALARKDLSKAKLAKEQLQQLGITERELVSQTNNYCLDNSIPR